MNGVDAVVIATGNDWRAVEAGAHAFAARSGTYISPSPRGARRETRSSAESSYPWPSGPWAAPSAFTPRRVSPFVCSASRARRSFASVAASVGLASTLAAVRALASCGIQRGHMALHARSVALAAGATGTEVERVATMIVEARDITIEAARKALDVARSTREDDRELATWERVVDMDAERRDVHLAKWFRLRNEVDAFAGVERAIHAETRGGTGVAPLPGSLLGGLA